MQIRSIVDVSQLRCTIAKVQGIDNTANNKTLSVHKVTENTELEFEGAYNDVLFVQNGFVYRNEDRSKVYFVDYDKNTNLLFDSNETNTNINYGTNDQDYLYCFEEKKEENTVICYRISWNGEKEKLFETISSKGAVALNLTVINNFLYYYDEEKGNVVELLRTDGSQRCIKKYQ